MDLINPRGGSSSRREGVSAARSTPRTARPKKKSSKAKPSLSLTCLIHQEADGYVSRCPELDVASQGDSIEEARANLIEAVELFLECASPSEIKRRVIGRVFITPFEVRLG